MRKFVCNCMYRFELNEVNNYVRIFMRWLVAEDMDGRLLCGSVYGRL